MRLLLLLLRRGGVPRRAYATLTPADMLRIQAMRGANLELDPRGVDYDLFETPSLEYTHQQREAPAVSDIPAPILTMQRVLRAGDFAAASRLFEQLEELGTYLDQPLAEYAHASRWCAASGEPRRAVRFLRHIPRSSHSMDTSYQVSQTLLWLVRSGDGAAMQQGMLLAAEYGYVRELRKALVAMYQGPFGGTQEAPQLWCALAAVLAAPTADLARLYGCLVRAQLRGHHAPMHDTLSFPVDAYTQAVLRGEPCRPERMSQHDSDRFMRHVRRDDVARMRSVLLGVLKRGSMPSIEHVATLLCRASRQAWVDMPPSECRDAYRVSTGSFLRPLRKRCLSFPGLWETATLRAREKEGDWHSALRLWQQRFEPVRGVYEPAVHELVRRARPPTLPYVASVTANSERRPERTRHERARIMPTPYAVATVLRAMVRAYGPDGKALAPMYAALVDAAQPGGPTASAACFEAFIAMSSRVDAKRFVSPRVSRTTPQQLPTMWTMLRDMQAACVVPRSSTWTLFLQALLRDRSRSKWRIVLHVLNEMHRGDHERRALLPRATPATYAGLLHVLTRVRQTSRTRRRRCTIRALMRRRYGEGVYATERASRRA